MYLDYYSYIMQAMIQMWNVMQLKENGYYNPRMNNYPITLHFNGNKDYIERMEDALAHKLFPKTNDKINGDYDILFTNYNVTRKVKYNDVCKKFIQYYY